MLSTTQRRGLEIRLRILDSLESLVTQDPYCETYHKQLSDFADNDTPEAIRAVLAWIESNEIAGFIIPRDVTDAGFWESPVRIREINPERLQTALRSVREELGPAGPVASSNDIPSNGDSLDTSARSPIFTSREGDAYLGIAGVIGLTFTLIGFVTAWHVLKTGLAQALTVVGILIIVAAIARLRGSIKDRRVSWPRSVTLLGFGILCICATIVLASIIGLPGQSGSKRAGGSASATIMQPVSGNINFVNTLSGEVFNLQRGELVFTFFQVVNTNGSINPQTYPASGPCEVNFTDQTWVCHNAYIGKIRDNGIYRVCAAVINFSDAYAVVELIKNAYAASLPSWFTSKPSYISDGSRACMSVHRIN